MRAARLLALVALGGTALAQPAALPLERFELAAAVAGRVCRDVDQDGRCGADEPGLAGLRVILETGQYAITDRQGRYHLAAVGARVPDADAGGRFLHGRHRLALDARALPSGSAVEPARVNVELPMGGLWVQDFAVRAQAPKAVASLTPSVELAPVAKKEASAIRFLLTGRVDPGDTVVVGGQTAELDAEGRYKAWVSLRPGPNDVSIVATARSGAVRFYVQRVDVMDRPGNYLIVPRPAKPTAQLQLPGGKEEKAAAGRNTLRVDAVPGTRIQHPHGELKVSQSGTVEIPVELRSGENVFELTIEPPGEPAHTDVLQIPAAPRPLVIGMLDMEGTFNRRSGTFSLFGRGAAHAEHRLGAWDLSLDLDLRDQDVSAVRGGSALALLLPRSPEQLERALDPERFSPEWADRSVGVVPNAAEGRLRLEARSEGFGRVGFGTHRVQMEDAEAGRFQRETFGPYLALSAPVGPVKLGLDGFFAPAGGDPTRGLATVPAHDELLATGGSLYYLGSPGIAAGSEEVRVEVRDGLTGLPLAERHLVRGVDYEIDYTAGRLILARPLSFAVSGSSVLRADALTASADQVLMVDYERLALASTGRQSMGGGASAEIGGVQLSLGGVAERSGDARYQLLRGRGSVPLGPAMVHVEAAQSVGGAVSEEDFGLSDDGGLSFLRPSARTEAVGTALGVRVRSPGLFNKGHVDAAFRLRTPGFSDRTHDDRTALRQLSLRAEQPLGTITLGLLVDDRLAADPRAPFEGLSIAARTLGLSAGYDRAEGSVRVEVKDTQLTAAADPVLDTPETGGRTSVGVSVRYHLLEPLDVLASHKQVLVARGSGPGAVADSFSMFGADLRLTDRGSVGLRAGWGPVVGPLAWFEGQYQSREGAAYYGSYSVDVDGPDYGQGKAVSGARTAIGDRGSVFVEDVAAHDASAVRFSRAVGFSQDVAHALHLTARYERGVRHPLDILAPLARDSAGLTASWIAEWARAFARAELRYERGSTLRGPTTDVERLQRLASAGLELDLHRSASASARLNFSDTSQRGVLEARLVEATASVAWRLDQGMAVLRYSLLRELPPPSRGGAFGERTLQTVSLLPAVRFGPRFSLAAGAHAGWSEVSGNTGLVLSASLRPAVKVVGGLELAAEVVRRTSAPDGGELTALRGELGYRVDDRVLLALGYTAFGFSGLGLSAGSADSQDRVYVRAELAY